MTWRDIPGDETVAVFKRTATRGGAEREKRELEMVECPEWNDSQPSRDAVAVCGTAMLIAGVFVGSLGAYVVGGVMSVVGLCVFCSAWGKRND